MIVDKEKIMKKNFKPNTWLYPQPVLVIASYGADGTADGMVAAWGGIYDCLLYTSPSPRDCS